jgi:hypothetical protein
MRQFTILAIFLVLGAAAPALGGLPAQPNSAQNEKGGPGLCRWLGIRYKSMGEGVLVQAVHKGSVAQVSGLQVADVIVQADDTVIRGKDDLHRFLLATDAGSRHEFHVLRRLNNENQRVTVEVGQAPEDQPPPLPAPTPEIRADRRPASTPEPPPARTPEPTAATEIATLETGPSGSPISLIGLREIAVLVEELTPELTDAGVSRAVLQTEVTQILEAHGIVVRRDADPYLYVLISGFEQRDQTGAATGLFSYAVDLSLRQTVRLASNPTIEVTGASTWLAMGKMGVRGKDSLAQDMAAIVDEMVGDYVAAYRQANRGE